MRLSIYALSAVSVLAVAEASPVRAQTWPTDASWTFLTCGDSPSFDPRGDEPGATGERDVVGDADAPALYYWLDATYLFFRMRVDGDPREGEELKAFNWGVEFDSDSVRTSYEVLASVNGAEDPEVVTVRRNTNQQTADDPSDPTEELAQTYPITTHARVVLAGGSFDSSFGGDPDYFIDWALDRDDLEAEGIREDTALVLVMGTSGDAVSLDADLACHVSGVDLRRISTASTDPVRGDGEEVPDSDDDGLSDEEEQNGGTDPNDRDSDDDGYSDGVEVREGTDPRDADSRPTGLHLRGGGGPAGCSVAAARAAVTPMWWLLLLGLCATIRSAGSRGLGRGAAGRRRRHRR